jgi:hypothetical protein
MSMASIWRLLDIFLQAGRLMNRRLEINYFVVAIYISILIVMDDDIFVMAI